MNDCDKFKIKLMGLLDGELNPAEASEVNQHLVRCPDCRREYDELRETSGKIADLSFVEPQDAVLEELWKAPYSRFSRNSALVLVLGGYAVLIAYSLFEFFQSKDADAIPKIAVGAIAVGFSLLLLLFVRERIKTYKIDPYRGVKR